MDRAAGVAVTNLTKRFGGITAVDNLTFTAAPGRVTGFLGPNGSGKTTTLRILLGLIRPTSGTATIGGARYVDLASPLRSVGAALEATGFHPGRSGRNHLRVLTDAAGLPSSRADEVLELTGLADAGTRLVGQYSLGMRQRLGLASALLGDPRVLILDEPANGLDPEGIRWLRGFLRNYASLGRTVLVSSHLLTEVQQTVDDVLIIARGALVRSGPIESIAGPPRAMLTTDAPAAVVATLAQAGIAARASGEDVLIDSSNLRLIGEVAFAVGARVYALHADSGDLESLFFSLTGGSPSDGVGGVGPS